jgi:hypothetical protein
MNRNEANEIRRRTAGTPPVFDPASGGGANGSNRSGSLWFRPQASATQRVSTINNAIAKTLYFTVGYALLARCMNRCTGLVRRIASGIFLINTGVAALAKSAQANAIQHRRAPCQHWRYFDFSCYR